MSRYVPLKDVARLSLSMMGILNTEWAYAMQGLPSIEIVHCRECKYWRTKQKNVPWNHSRKYCTRVVTMNTKADDFCSYGCKRGEE